MSHPRTSLLLAAAACVVALAAPAVAQDVSASQASKAMGKAAAKYHRVQVSEDATAEAPTSNCRVEHWEADYISHPLAYHTECGPR